MLSLCSPKGPTSLAEPVPSLQPAPPPATLFGILRFSLPNMTGRPGHRTMEMNGGSSAPYLACTPCVPLFCTLFNGRGKGLLDYQGRAGIISIVRWNLRPVIFGVEFWGPVPGRQDLKTVARRRRSTRTEPPTS